jgi:hypothetical protein
VRRGAWAAAALALAGAGPALAHHGTAQYDFSRDLTLTGRVKAYDYASPHIWLTLEAAGPDGASRDWSLEGPPPIYAARRGWARDSLQPGQPVQVTFSPLRGGSSAGIILTVRDRAGRVLLERGRRY